eukprot:jgi/Psemu1/311511/fgenesh1_kg.786_\
MFTQELGVKSIHHSNKRGRSVSAYVASESKKSKSEAGTFTGTLEAKNYPVSVYRTFSHKQREQVKELR